MTNEPQVTLSHAAQAQLASIAELVGRWSADGFVGADVAHQRVSQLQSIRGSLAIEGNRMTEEEISDLIAGRPVVAAPREVKEVRNAVQTYENLTRWVSSKEQHLRDAHAMLLDGLSADAGQYRRWGVGVVSKHKVVHVAPKPEDVPGLMAELFAWFGATEMHPLVASAVFHYRFEYIHPFSDGNGRMGRLWQTLRLIEWQPLFQHVPVESLLCQFESEYYDAIAASTESNDAGAFVEFMVRMVDLALRTYPQTDQVADQATDQVNTLLAALGEKVKSSAELMADTNLKHRPTFRNNYLNPAIEAGYIERTQPDAPKSPTQRYRLTTAGRRILKSVSRLPSSTLAPAIHPEGA